MIEEVEVGETTGVGAPPGIVQTVVVTSIVVNLVSTTKTRFSSGWVETSVSKVAAAAALNHLIFPNKLCG